MRAGGRAGQPDCTVFCPPLPTTIPTFKILFFAIHFRPIPYIFDLLKDQMFYIVNVWLRNIIWLNLKHFINA